MNQPRLSDPFWCVLWLCFACGWVMVGCDRKPEPNYGVLGLVEVSGQLLLDGLPLPEAEVRFVAEDSTYSFGISDAQGRYRLMFDSRKSGVIPGEKRVVVLSKAASEEEEGSNEGSGSGTTSGANRAIPKVYGPQSSIKITITQPEANVVFDLQSDGSTKGPKQP
jgi:hypothetical protein